MRRLQIKPEDWTQFTKLLDAALELPVAARAKWLEELDARCEPFKSHLRNLLSQADSIETSDFLQTLPKLDVHLPEAALPDAPVQTGTLLGPYRLLRELGSGGMGLVWLAERADGLISRPVALKIPRGLWIREGFRERMAREREILASLEHPGIARLYDAGLTDAGDPYLALEYVEGQPLDVYCSERHLGILERLGLFLQVIDAVAYAHSKLIVHRDLKPANILVTEAGQVLLLDFGIGKLLDEQQASGARLTELSSQALTPDYASPEQIAGRPLTVGTDIYSLGVILYELLAGQRPYRLKRNSRGALEDAILEADPRRPSQVAAEPARQKQLHGDLDAIALKTLRKLPAERYTTAQSLGDDIRRYLAGHPVLARPDSRAYRTRKFLMRHRFAAGTVAVACLAVVTGATVAVWQAQLAKSEARRAENVAQFIASIFQGVDPNLLGAARPLTATEILDQAQRRLAVELAGEPQLRLHLHSVIGRSYLGLYEPQRARVQRGQSTGPLRGGLYR